MMDKSQTKAALDQWWEWVNKGHVESDHLMIDARSHHGSCR